MPADAVAAVHHHLDFSFNFDSLEKIIFVNAGNILLGVARSTPGIPAAFHNLAKFLDLRSEDRAVADADFEAVEFRRIMTSRDHDAAADTQVTDGKIKHGGGAKPDVDGIDSRGVEPLD